LNNNTFAVFGYTNTSNSNVGPSGGDQRQIWESAVYGCIAANGTLANITDSNAGFLGSLFAYYRNSIAGASTGWGNRKACAWVGLTNIVSNFSTSLKTTTITSELFWAEDAGAKCGAVSDAEFRDFSD
jgi:hypothetical protein